MFEILSLAFDSVVIANLGTLCTKGEDGKMNHSCYSRIIILKSKFELLSFGPSFLVMTVSWLSVLSWVLRLVATNHTAVHPGERTLEYILLWNPHTEQWDRLEIDTYYYNYGLW